MLGGRERFALAIGNYQRGLLKGQTPKTATLSKRKGGSYYLNIQLESIPPEPKETDNQGNRIQNLIFGQKDENPY
jgi:putative transposase